MFIELAIQLADSPTEYTMSTAQANALALSFTDEVTRNDIDCTLLRRASRIRRAKLIAVRTLTISYLTLSSLALVLVACQ